MKKLLLGDCLERLKELPSQSVHSFVSDPPAGISFMGKDWDDDKGGRDAWIDWMTSVMKEVFRVLKPGAHGVVWAIPRTSHWTSTAIENAGFEVRDVLTHLFGSGFPKSHDISKAIDELAGAERKVIAQSPNWRPTKTKGSGGFDRWKGSDVVAEINITEPASPAAKKWSGWGTALKPAAEFYILCRKPLDQQTVVQNVLKYNTGGINIDASRIEYQSKEDQEGATTVQGRSFNVYGAGNGLHKEITAFEANPQGRFPSNLLLSHNCDCLEVGTKKVKTGTAGKKSRPFGDGTVFGTCKEFKPNGTETYASADGTETVPEWECTEGCPIKMLDDQTGELQSGGTPLTRKGMGYHGSDQVRSPEGVRGNSGSASRFFYCAKASMSEKNAGLEDLPIKQALGGGGLTNVGDKFGSIKAAGQNFHPTVKSLALMTYLIKMVTPPRGVILDCFMGSGSTGCAARKLGFGFIGIERDPEYFHIAEKRIEHWEAHV